MCDFHSGERGVWLIVDHPFAAISNASGQFEITGLLPGKHSFRIWHEAAGFLNRGFEVEVTAGETSDLGEITYPLGVFAGVPQSQ